MTLLYDSDNPDSIPDGVWAAGYVDGYAANAWATRGWARFPNAKRIAVFGQTNDGDCLDVERGDATPNEAPGWVLWRRAAGVQVPWVYCNRSNRSLVELALNAAGIAADQVALWVATLDGTQTVPAGPYPVAAVQYANSLSSGGHYDLSIVDAQYSGSSGSLGADMLPDERGWLMEIRSTLLDGPPKGAWNGWSQTVTASLARIESTLAGFVAPGASGGLTAAQAATLDTMAGDIATLKRLIEKDLAP